MEGAIILIISIVIMVLLFLFFNNYPDPIYFETYVSGPIATKYGKLQSNYNNYW